MFILGKKKKAKMPTLEELLDTTKYEEVQIVSRNREHVHNYKNYRYFKKLKKNKRGNHSIVQYGEDMLWEKIQFWVWFHEKGDFLRYYHDHHYYWDVVMFFRQSKLIMTHKSNSEFIESQSTGLSATVVPLLPAFDSEYVLK